ncbi:MAG: polyphosphate polymerase domain-containing protein [Proteobacteria bacterium]|nr:polyphosphate polymerase domain-containing protein [Pseudomonadota bacterium]
MLRHLGDGKTEDPSKSRLTAVRREVKYLLSQKEAEEAFERISERIPPKVVNGSSRNYRISIYLDGPDHKLARAELDSEKRSVKLRIKDYYTFESTAPVFAEKCWLEVKVRLGSMVEKSRFAVNRDVVARALNHGPGPMDNPKDQVAAEAFESVRADQLLEPLLVAHYRRATLQDTESRMRVTFDDQLTFHMPPRHLCIGRVSCSRGDLPPPLRVEPKWVLEIKSLGSPPSWMEEIVNPELEVNYSKFGTGVRELAQRGLLRIPAPGDE